jgi:hypothetical protein
MSLTLIAVIGGFIMCLMGTLVLLEGNVMLAVLLMGLGLIIVAVLAGLVEKLFDLFTGIFGGVFGD